MPVEAPALSTDTPTLPDPATLDAPNDSDQCSECRCAPRQPHAVSCTAGDSHLGHTAPGCERTAQNYNEHINAAPSHRIGTCYIDPDTGETVMPPDFFGEKELRWTPRETAAHIDHGHPPIKVPEPPKCPVCCQELGTADTVNCDHCEELIGVESFAVVNGPGGVFVYHLPCYDEVYWGGQGAGQETSASDENPLQNPAELLDKMSDRMAAECAEVAELMAEGYREMASEPEPARSAIGAGPLFAGNPLHAHMRATFDACLEIGAAKNAGYAGDADPLANFQTAEALGIPVPLGIAVRMSDKWARLTRLLKTGENPLPSESITDTLQDLINYAAILLYSLETD